MIREGVSVGVDEAGAGVEDLEGASSGGSLEVNRQFPKGDLRLQLTYGRKLHDEDGRLATSVKISEISRCCTAVSFGYRQCLFLVTFGQCRHTNCV